MDGSLPPELLGDWAAVEVFTDDGDTIPYSDIRPVLHFASDGTFAEYRGDTVVSRGAVLIDCDDFRIDLASGHRLCFTDPARMLDSAPGWHQVLVR